MAEIEVFVQEEEAVVALSETNVVATGSGSAGGYYMPSVSEDGDLSWLASQSGMPSINPTNIKGTPGDDGTDGKDGVSPTVAVTETTDGYTVTITDANGTQSFNLKHGEKGERGTSPKLRMVTTDGGYRLQTLDDRNWVISEYPLYHGKDGVSPTMTVTEGVNSHTVTIKDANGTQSFDVTDGVSPTISVQDVGVGYLLKITDVNGERSVTLRDGADGESPAVRVDEVEGGHRVCFYNGATVVGDFTVNDGQDYILTDADKQEIAGMVVAPDGGTTASAVDKPLTMQKIGVLYDNPEGYDYVAWCPGNLLYDPNLEKYVSLVYGSTQHVNGTTALFVSYIDPKTYEATAPVRCYTDDGATALTGSTACWIDDDGTYKMLYKYTDNVTHLFSSVDGGINWVKGDAVSGFSGSPWGITKLSNGRLICGDDQTKVGIYYSDNGGVTWTQVIPGTSGGGYEAEACILELEPGKLIAIARYSMSGIGYNASGPSEPAIVSFSEDYGTTWTAWKKSETITNMNASSCAGYVHNGMVDVFAASRWYWNDNAANDDYTNTGKTGAITHYTATIENALQDNFTNAGILTYANAFGANSSQDFHCPALAVKDDDVLLMWFDRIYPFTEEITSHYFARGSANGMDYAPNDSIVSAVFPYSSQMVKKLLAQQYADLITKVNEAILSGGIIKPENPSDPDAPTSYIMEDVVLNFNFLDSAKQDTTAMTLTDSINNVVGTFKTTNNGATTVSAFPTVRDNSVTYAHLVLPANTLSEFITDDPYAMSIELAMYYESQDEWNEDMSGAVIHGGAFFSNGGGAGSVRIGSNRLTPFYTNTSGSNVNALDSSLDSKKLYSLDAPNTLQHCVVTMAADGTTCYYNNGELTGGPAVIHSSFAKWAAVNLTRGFTFNGPLKVARVYKRALTADEVLNNYKYELNSIK